MDYYWMRKVDDKLELISALLQVVSTKVDIALSQGEKLMALADDLKASIAQLNTETTAIGDLITSLAGKIHNSMTDSEVVDVKTALGTLSSRLTTLAVDPTNPVPAPPPAFRALGHPKP